MNNNLRCVLTVLIMLFGSTINAGELRDLMDKNSKQLLSQIEIKRDFYAENPQKLNAWVKENISEYFHFKYMGRYAVGRYWKKMTKEQQKEYSDLFVDLLVGTYATSIMDLSYKDITIEDEKKGHKKNRFVLTMFARKKGEKFRVDYDIAKTRSGPKIINVKLEGISLLINYRKSFGSVLSKEGPAALIEFIKNKTSSLKQEKKK